MDRIKLILKETFWLIRNHKLYFLTPILVVLALIALLIHTVGPAVMMAFLYAGI